MHRLIFAIMFALAQPALAQLPADESAAAAAVKITHCAITKPRPLSHRPTGTQIAYVNTGPVLLHRITFTVAYRGGGETFERSVEDAGTFAPNTPVDHHYSLYSDVTFAGTTPLRCRVTAAR